MSVNADVYEFGPFREAREFVSTPVPLRPEADPFYRAPADIVRFPAGAIIRFRKVEAALFGRLRLRAQAWQLLYRTVDLHGAAEASVTTVLLPRGATPAQSRPLLSFQCAIDAVSAKCLPSYALRHGARAGGSVPSCEMLLIMGALAHGWAVSVPDHVGLDGRFVAAREPAYRILDALRAARSFEPVGQVEQIGLWGYSGGGVATSWAAELAHEYAPELPLVGAVAGSPVGDPELVFARVNGSFFSGLTALALSGLRRAYPEVDAIVRANVDAEGLAFLAKAEASSTIPFVARARGRNLDRHCRGSSLAELIAMPDVRAVFDDIRPGTRAPAMPLLIMQSVRDQIIPVEGVDGQVDRYLADGARVRYLRDRLSEHLSLAVFSAPVALDWLSDRFAGLPAPEGTETLWSVAFSRQAGRGLRRWAGRIRR
ncbi:lipase [Nocardia huaxiensis]|uniref:Lipase n=1 Tax=Nocardia huaxiensis TaxID=2755382 RepID=A0A7D6ZCL3_9NOCA|nr:lipase family protein [Nocardia huaxiensis]QLY30458.1 lipase [Nocardia huaxiensis]